MLKPETNNTLWINTQERTPERFWFTEKQAAKYREQLVRGDSEWVFLYEWNDSEDRTGSESGGCYYNKVANSAWYNVSSIESSILEKMNTVWQRLAKRKNHIELWTAAGIANKFKNVIFPLFCKKRKDWYTHIDIDTSSPLIDSCRKEYTDQEHLSFNPIVQDRRQKWLVDEINDKAYYRLWWSIGNFSEDQVVEILRNLSSDSSVVGREIIISHFLRPEEPDQQKKIEQLKQQYSCPEVQEWILKWFASLWFDTNNLSFVVDYEPWVTVPDCIKVGAKLKKDTWIDIGWWDKVLKHAGEHIWAIRSRRYTKEQFWTLADKAWCTLQDTVSADDASMAVSVLKTARKKLSLPTKITSAVAWSLLLLFGWVEAWKYVEQQKWQRIKNHATEEIFLWNKDLSIHQFNSTVMQIIYDLEHIYGNTLNDAKKHILDWMIQDFLKKHKQNFTYYKSHAMGQIYYTGLYTPSLLQKFIVTNKQTLLSMQIQTVPYEHFLQEQEALQNSFFYVWDRLEFDDIDKKLWDYEQFTITNINGVEQKPSYWHYGCGIKNIRWKPYFVVKTAWSESYVLQPKSDKLQSQWALCSGDVVAEIIWRGEVSILAEKIRHFLHDKYWTEKHGSVAMNWQARLAAYLLDRYAEWWDLSFLISDYAKDNPFRWNYEELLEKFVFSYVLPACESDLREYKAWNSSWDRMHDIDWERVDSDSDLFTDYSWYVDQYDQFLHSYIPEEYARHAPWGIKSVLLKLFLVWQKSYYNSPQTTMTIEQTLNNPQLMRAWITKHRDEFLKEWILVPEYPVAIEEIILTWKRGKMIYDLNDNFKWIPAKEAMYHGYIQEYLWWYTDIHWNSFDIGISTAGFSTPHLVARMRRGFEDEQLLNDRKKWKYGKIYLESDIQPYWKILLTDSNDQSKKQLLQELRNKIIWFSSHDMHLIVHDCKQWMKAMEQLNK